MAKLIDDQLHRERHSSMLAYQQDISPFIPTIRELMELWGVNTTSSVHLTLNRLVELGLCITRQHGPGKSYYAVEPNALPLAQTLEGIGMVAELNPPMGPGTMDEVQVTAWAGPANPAL